MSHAVQGHSRQMSHEESSDKPWSTGGKNGKLLEHTCCENLKNCIKKEKYITCKDEPSRLECVQYNNKASGGDGISV